MKFSGICLLTNDVSRLVHFYEDIFDTRADGDEFHAEITLEGLNLAIFSKLGMEKMAAGCMQDAGHGGFTLGFYVEDLDPVFEKIKTLDIEFVKLPETHPWGARSFWFRDPDGNIVDIWSNSVAAQ